MQAVDFSEWAKIVFGVALAAVLLRVVVWPEVRGWLAASGGRLEKARVLAFELTSTRNERKQYLHRAVLRVEPNDGEPYEVTVTEHVPWLHGDGRSLETVMVRVHPRRRTWVTMVGPGEAEAFLREREPR